MYVCMSVYLWGGGERQRPHEHTSGDSEGKKNSFLSHENEIHKQYASMQTDKQANDERYNENSARRRQGE